MDDPRAGPRLKSREIFGIFFRAGLAFGGGLGILAVLEEELVTRRRLVTREEFLTQYALGRLVPAGTMTALAVGFGQRLGGFRGSAVALAALVLPAFASALALTLLYERLRDGALLEWLPVSLLPAALAFIATAALRMGREVAKPGIGLVLAVATFGCASALDWSPILLLLGGGVAGALLMRGEAAK